MGQAPSQESADSSNSTTEETSATDTLPTSQLNAEELETITFLESDVDVLAILKPHLDSTIHQNEEAVRQKEYSVDQLQTILTQRWKEDTGSDSLSEELGKWLAEAKDRWNHWKVENSSELDARWSVIKREYESKVAVLQSEREKDGLDPVIFATFP